MRRVCGHYRHNFPLTTIINTSSVILGAKLYIRVLVRCSRVLDLGKVQVLVFMNSSEAEISAIVEEHSIKERLGVTLA